MKKLNALGNTHVTLLARALFRIDVRDVCTGLWGYRGDAIRHLELETESFEIEANMLTECVKRRLSLAEVPISYSAQVDQAKLASFRGGARIGALSIIKWYFGPKEDRDRDKARGNDRLAPESKQVTLT